MWGYVHLKEPLRIRTTTNFLGRSGGPIEDVFCSSVTNVVDLRVFQTSHTPLKIPGKTLSLSITTDVILQFWYIMKLLPWLCTTSGKFSTNGVLQHGTNIFVVLLSSDSPMVYGKYLLETSQDIGFLWSILFFFSTVQVDLILGTGVTLLVGSPNKIHDTRSQSVECETSTMWNSTLCCSVRQFLISSSASLKRSTILRLFLLLST